MNQPQIPSTASIVKATVVALIVAVVILVTAVLPAEYGKDPVGTGKLLGLMDLSQAASGSTPSVQAGVNTLQPRVYKVDAEDFGLEPGQSFEFKYHMQKGASMVYSWKSNVRLQFEFHGEPDVKPSKDYYDSYEQNYKEGKAEYHGSFIAPSTGIHGWFWKNNTKESARFRLVTAGFYESAKMFADNTAYDMPLEDAK